MHFLMGSNLVTTLSSIFALQIPDVINYFHPIYPQLTDYFYNRLAAETLTQDPLTMMVHNLTDGVAGALMWSVETGRISLTLTLFLLGIVLYRSSLFTRSKNFFVKTSAISLMATIAFYFLKTNIAFPPFQLYYNLTSFLFGASLLVLIFRYTQGFCIWRHLMVYGRMSLSNFIGQSIICSFLFYSWGLHLTPYLGTFFSVMVSVVVLLVQVAFSHYWLARHKRGPLEEIWHRLTNLNQPRKSTNS